MQRNRYLYTLWIVLTLAAGLASRRYAAYLPHWVYLYMGDALWALLVFWVIAWCCKQKSTIWVTVAALLFAYSIEVSQLYQAPWLNAIRDTTLGSLVLGHGFLYTDLVMYTLGIGFGFMIEQFQLKKRKKNLQKM